MPPHAKDLTRPCEYYGRKGPCGKSSYNGTCKSHRNRESLKPCLLCGHGTASKTGYCPCSYRQIYVGQKMKREHDTLEALVDELLAAI